MFARKELMALARRKELLAAQSEIHRQLLRLECEGVVSDLRGLARGDASVEGTLLPAVDHTWSALAENCLGARVAQYVRWAETGLAGWQLDQRLGGLFKSPAEPAEPMTEAR